MFYKKSPGERAFDIGNVAFMVFLVVITLYPMLYVLFASISRPLDFMRHSGVLLWPLGFTTVSYQAVFENPNVLGSYGNTMFIVIVGLLVNLVMTALGAYFLSRKNVMWKNWVMFLIVITMFFSGGMIPAFLNVKRLGLYNSLWALIIPGAISTYNMIIMRTAFAAIPDELIESVTIDGGGHFTILFRIILPLSSATMAVMVLYYGVAHWNAWFDAMIYLQDRAKFPLQLILREILIQNRTDTMTTSMAASDHAMISETIQYALIVVATAPILCLYPFLQRYFVKGVMIGALKG